MWRFWGLLVQPKISLLSFLQTGTTSGFAAFLPPTYFSYSRDISVSSLSLELLLSFLKKSQYKHTFWKVFELFEWRLSENSLRHIFLWKVLESFFFFTKHFHQSLTWQRSIELQTIKRSNCEYHWKLYTRRAQITGKKLENWDQDSR